MKVLPRITIAAVALLGLWAGFAYQVSRPPEASDYLRTAVQVATSAHDAAATGVLVGRQQLRGHLTGPFADTAYDDALRAVAGAQHELAAAIPPDPATTALRDRLAPLVQAAGRSLTDAAGAADESRLRAAIDDLDETADRLDRLIEEHR
ncbi:hypothetical protein ACGFI9_02925 [Micromonospora sp. NPDC048930]|uniref:hypothetical protein n=1 Tax=Micromonospora sp. NPDC048930 TaxID=3364261 RepID=UPI00372490A5